METQKEVPTQSTAVNPCALGMVTGAVQAVPLNTTA